MAYYHFLSRMALKFVHCLLTMQHSRALFLGQLSKLAKNLRCWFHWEATSACGLLSQGDGQEACKAAVPQGGAEGEAWESNRCRIQRDRGYQADVTRRCGWRGEVAGARLNSIILVIITLSYMCHDSSLYQFLVIIACVSSTRLGRVKHLNGSQALTGWFLTQLHPIALMF